MKVSFSLFAKVVFFASTILGKADPVTFAEDFETPKNRIGWNMASTPNTPNVFHRVPNSNPTVYTQRFETTYSTPEDAAKASARPLLLPLGKTLAFSTRWDDSNTRHVNMEKALQAAGCQGTFYLNQVDNNFRTNTLPKLLAHGCSVGAHTTTHPFLPMLSPNAVFQEILENRITIETAGNTPVVAFTLPFRMAHNGAAPQMKRVIGDALVRSGLMGGGDVWSDAAKQFEISDSPWVGTLHFSIGDRDPQQARFTEYVRRLENLLAKNRPDCGPHLTLGTHTWQTDEGLARLTEILKNFAKRPEVWCCNENQYIARWSQIRNGSIKNAQVVGKTVTWEIKRLDPAETGATEELGIRLSPMPISATFDGKSLPVTSAGEISVPHSAGLGVPVKIDAVHNNNHLAASDASLMASKFRGVQCSLKVDTQANRAILYIKNGANVSLKDFRVTFRLPPQWKDGTRRFALENELAPGSETTLPLTLGSIRTEVTWQEGPLFFAAQCDFRIPEGPSRIYATETVAGKLIPRDVPRDCFVISAPFLRRAWSDKQLAAVSDIKASVPTDGIILYPMNARTNFGDIAVEPDSVAVEYKKALRKMKVTREDKKSAWLMVVDFESPADTAKFFFDSNRAKKVFLNGKPCTAKGAGDTSPVAIGLNRIVLYIPTETWYPCMPFGVVSTTTGNLLKFKRPELPRRLADLPNAPISKGVSRSSQNKNSLTPSQTNLSDKCREKMARLAGFEPTTLSFEG